MYWIRDWLEAEAKNHDSEWGNKILRNIRVNMKPLISKEKAILGMSYLEAKQDMSFVKSLFINAALLNLDNVNNRPNGWGVAPYDNKAAQENFQYGMGGVNFVALPLWERIKNIMIAEMKKMGIIITCRADDPASTVAKKHDEAIIKNKRKIEKAISAAYTSVGQKPVSLDSHEDRFGEKVGNGNIEQFASMNFDESNPDDVSTFMRYFHKLTWEIAAQKAAMAVIDFNQLDQKIDMWVTDFIAKKAIAGQIYRNEISGQLQAEYIAPETVWVLGGGRRKDFNDANAKVIEVSISISEMLARIGDEFDFESMADKLIMAVTFTTGQEITGIHSDGRYLWGDRKGKATDGTYGAGDYLFNDFMQLKVTVGYAEWITQVQFDYGAEITTKISKSKSYYQDNQNPTGEKYPGKARFETPTYKSYYLALSSNTQIMFKFGKLDYQDIEGYNDRETVFTIITWKEIGDPLAIMAIPLIDIFHEAWYKFKHEVRVSKARGMGRNIDSVMQMAEELYQDTGMNQAAKVQAMVQYLSQSPDELYKYPEIEGQTHPIPGNQQSYQIPNGLTDGVMQWWTVMLQTEQKIIDLTTGNSPLRQGDAPAARTSMNNEFKALENSENSTYYIPDGITFMLQSMATRIMLYTQDIVTYKTYDTLSYKFLCDLVGEETLMQIEGMGKKAMHRFGILVESLNQAPQRMKIDRRIEIGLQTKTLTMADTLLVEDIKSPKEAGLVLAYLEQRNAKIAQKNAMESQKAQSEQAMQIEQMKLNQIIVEGQLRNQGIQITADASIQSHLLSQSGGITKQAMKHSSDVEKIEAQAQANILEQQELLNNTGKTTPQPVQQAPVPQQSAPIAQPHQNNNESAIQQQMAAAQPMSTGFNG